MIMLSGSKEVQEWYREQKEKDPKFNLSKTFRSIITGHAKELEQREAIAIVKYKCRFPTQKKQDEYEAKIRAQYPKVIFLFDPYIKHLYEIYEAPGLDIEGVMNLIFAWCDQKIKHGLTPDELKTKILSYLQEEREQQNDGTH
jgi:hypothetical protein